MIGYCIVCVGVVMAPLLPFAGLVIISLLAVWLGAPIGALVFAMLLDSFLLPDGVAPLWISLVLYTILFLPLYVYLRYTTS